MTLPFALLLNLNQQPKVIKCSRSKAPGVRKNKKKDEGGREKGKRRERRGKKGEEEGKGEWEGRWEGRRKESGNSAN